jgi:hypothetical protein
MSRISTPMKYSSQVRWSVCSVQVFRHVSSSSLLVSLHLCFYRFMTSLTMSSYFSYFSIVSLKK